MLNTQRHAAEQNQYHTLLFNNQKNIIDSFECEYKKRINFTKVFTKVYLTKCLIKDIANIIMSY